MPQIIIVKKRSVNSEPEKESKVLIVVAEEQIEVYTDQDAEEKMARDA